MPKTKTGGRQTKKLPSREAALPSKKDVLEFIAGAPTKVGKREIARAFGVKGSNRIGLKTLLREMSQEGAIKGSRRKLAQPRVLPEVTVIVVRQRDANGDSIAFPESWDDDAGPPPRILMVEGVNSAGPALGIGDRLLARLTPVKGDDFGHAYEARPIKRLPKDARSLLGVFRALPDGGGVIDPVEKKQLREWPVAPHDANDARNGELVRFSVSGNARFGASRARVEERLGHPGDQRQISLIAIHNHGIPDVFPEVVLREADGSAPADLNGREDLRGLPLITIDPVDARDHDDAVFAEADPDPANAGGWIVIVAIADVAHFVRPYSMLDKEALKRGNSVYFPDQVVPMLPEPISNDLCSLRQGEDRACLAVRMVFDAQGRKKSHRFTRGLMRSAAKLAYAQAQAAIEGMPDTTTAPLLAPVLEPLWKAYRAVAKARDARAPLDLDLPERKVLLDEAGRVKAVVSPPRLDAHRLIEEFMIQANVAAAESLEAKKQPLIYRVHDAPSKEKLIALGEFLRTLDISLSKGVLKPEHFNRILAATRGREVTDLVSEVILRSQAQAEYNPANIGHFGLNLRRYAHFTSPIRRYADLVVHRALIRALGLGEGGLTDDEAGRLADTAEAISGAERRAMAAERETLDRLIAAYLADRIGARFAARISGVTRSGLFVRLSDTGADGFIPISTLGREYFVHDEARRALIGERTGETYQLGQQVEVRLVEAVPSAGALRFEMLTEGMLANRALKQERSGSGKLKPPSAVSKIKRRRR